MPIRYQFNELATKETPSLNEIDKRMCADLNIPVDDKNFCGLYIFCETLGSSPHVQDKQGKIVKKKLQEYVKKVQPDITDANLKLVFKYLIEDYEFVSWWESRRD